MFSLTPLLHGSPDFLYFLFNYHFNLNVLSLFIALTSSNNKIFIVELKFPYLNWLIGNNNNALALN